MFSPLRNRFGIPGVISVIALVFAMMGGAYAASNGNPLASASKAKKGPRGPKGHKGDTGPAGPVGAQGPVGAKGDKGDNGSAGANGKSTETVSFTGSKGPIGGVTCTAGGVEVKSASATTLICNGKNGTNGQTGFTETLPPGKTETGAWAVGPARLAGPFRVPISFNIPLAAPLASTNVHYINAAGKEVPTPGVEVDSTVCNGTALVPTADPGNLCVYAGFEFELLLSNNRIIQVDETSGASAVGAVLQIQATEENGGGTGSWALTAEEG
jgi:hypothetical protein